MIEPASILCNYCEETYLQEGFSYGCVFVLRAYETSVNENPGIQILDSKGSGISCGV